MKSDADLLLAQAEYFERLVLAQQTSSQAGDYYKALIDSGVLGLVDGNPPQFDVNSKAGDIIFGIFDKFGFRGKMNISVIVDAKGNATLNVVTNPTHAQVAQAIKQAFESKVAMVCKRLSAPVDTVTLSNVVTAANA